MNQENASKKFIHWIHSPFSFEHQGTKVECMENGKIKITQDHNDDTFDEVTISESVINRLSRMLYVSRKKVWKDYPFKEE